MVDPVTPNTLMAQLRAQIDVLNEVVLQCAQTATVFDIPTYPNGTVPDVIEPERVSGDAAITMATSAFRQFSRPKEQHPGSVFRLPGVITVDKDLRAAVKRVNGVKAELKELIHQTYLTEKTRSRFHRTAFPGRVMLQVYRNIATCNRQIERVRFSWMPITRSTKSISRADVIETLMRRGKLLAETSDIDGALAAKIALREVLSTSQDAEYVIIKPRSPYPTTVLYYKHVKNGKKMEIVAPSLPVIIGPTEEDIDVGILAPLDTKKDRTKRTDEQQVKSIYKPAYLYVKN